MTDPDATTDVTPDIDADDYIPLSVDDVLGQAKTVRRTASICLRADLQAEYDRLLEELTSLVSATGEVIDDGAESSIGEESSASRAEALTARVMQVRREMAGAMWHVTFEGMPSDEWTAFVKRHKPKDQKADHTDYYNRLVFETAVSPTISMDQMKALRKKFTAPPITELITKALEASGAGGLDVPKLPASLRLLAVGSSED